MINEEVKIINDIRDRMTKSRHQYLIDAVEKAGYSVAIDYEAQAAQKQKKEAEEKWKMEQAAQSAIKSLTQLGYSVTKKEKDAVQETHPTLLWMWERIKELETEEKTNKWLTRELHLHISEVEGDLLA